LIVFIGFGFVLMPVLAGIMIAYLLEGAVQGLQRMGIPRILAVVLIFILFLTGLILILVGIIPKLSLQISDFLEHIPDYMIRIRSGLDIIPEQYPEFISQGQFDYFMNEISVQLNKVVKQAALRSLSGLMDFIGSVVYVFLVPVLVFFFMKDKESILLWALRFLPKNRPLVDQIGRVVNIQLSNYIRGKAIEMTFPVMMAGFLQFGLSSKLMWLTIVYILLQQLDGNVLVPILFSRVNNLHPVAIITAVLVFGGIWGFWGVFFAIPLATIIQAVIQAWPKESHSDVSQIGP